MTTASVEPRSTTAHAAAGKYLTFCLGRNHYGVAVLRIREIIRMTDIKAVPATPDYVSGAINLRGRSIPVVDLRIKFGIDRAGTSERTCIVVFQASLAAGGRALVGMIVDAVEEVITVAPGEVVVPSATCSKLETRFILGTAMVHDSPTTLLDVDRIASATPLETVVAA